MFPTSINYLLSTGGLLKVLVPQNYSYVLLKTTNVDKCCVCRNDSDTVFPCIIPMHRFCVSCMQLLLSQKFQLEQFKNNCFFEIHSETLGREYWNEFISISNQERVNIIKNITQCPTCRQEMFTFRITDASSIENVFQVCILLCGPMSFNTFRASLPIPRNTKPSPGLSKRRRNNNV